MHVYGTEAYSWRQNSKLMQLSQVSYYSKASSRLIAIATAMAWAKGEAAQICLTFAEKEMGMKVKKTRLKTSMEMFFMEREAITAIRETEAL